MVKFSVFIDLTGNTSQVVPHKGAYNFITILRKKNLFQRNVELAKIVDILGKDLPLTRGKNVATHYIKPP